MKNQIKGLVVILLMLVGLYVLMMPGAKDIPINAKRFFDFDVADVSSFQINHFVTAFLFEETDNIWTVKQVRNALVNRLEKKADVKLTEADEKAVEANPKEVVTVLTYLTELKVMSPISVEKNQNKKFQINEHSLHVVMFDRAGNELGRLYVGKSGPDPMTSFVKGKDSDEIYLVNQDFNRLLIRNFEDWLVESEKQKRTDKK